MAETKRGRGRPRREDFSDTQRRVLDLLVQGRTNGEVAQELGISLDGAKYHVREICDRAGVDTREEAAEWWRQQRGLRARFALGELGARVSRMPALVKLGLGGAGAAGVAVGVVLFLMLPGLEPEGDIGPGLYVAYVVPMSEPPPEEPPDDADDLRIPHTELHVVYPGGEHVREGGMWGELRWSPDGSKLAGIHYANAGDAAMGAPEPPGLEVIDIASGDRKTIDPGSGSRLFWSPDSSRLAVTGGGARIFDRSGDRIAEFVDPDPEDDTGEEYRLLDGYALNECPAQPLFTHPPGPREVWSPDSRRLAMVTGEELVVLDRDGNRVASTGYERLRELGDAALGWGETFRDSGTGGFYVQGRWTSDRTLQVLLPVNPADADPREERRCVVALEGELVEGELEWQVQEDIPRMDHLRAELNRIIDAEAYGGDWVPTGPGERFDGGRVELALRHGRNVDAAWVVYAEDGEDPSDADDPHVAMAVHRHGEVRAWETDMDPGWATANRDMLRTAFSYDAWYVAAE